MNARLTVNRMHRPGRRVRGWYAAGALLAVLISGAMPARAAEPVRVLGVDLDLSCQQPTPLRLECEYRLVEPSEVRGASASVAGVALPAPRVSPYREPPSASAILFLVDTSDPGRQAIIERNVTQIRRLIAGTKPHHRLGFATFDSDLRMLSPLGSPPDAIARAVGNISAVGKTTELYRSTVEAIRRLAAFPAERRALILMSDGLAEDRAYFHEDVVRAAREAGVVIYGLGYPRSVALSVGLQSVRRLAEETGGPFVPADLDGRIAEGFFDAPFRRLDNGGTLSVDLDSAREALASASRPSVQIAMTTGTGTASAAVPVQLPPPPPRAAEPIVKVVEVEVPKVVEVERIVEVQVPAKPTAQAAPGEPAAPPPAPVATGPTTEIWLWYGLVAALLVALLVLLVLVVRARRGPGGTAIDDATAVLPAAAGRTLAFLEMGDESGQRHPISSSAFRIGRHVDNDLRLIDPSVSRQHAEIHRRRDGSFSLTDLDSMNGVFVNGEKISQSGLADGDLVEIGDVAMRFTVVDADRPGGEETVMLKTVIPVAPLPEPREKRA